MQELLSDPKAGVRAFSEVRGRWTRLTIELRDLAPGERQKAAASLAAFALGLWARFDEGPRSPRARQGSGD